MPCCGPPPSSGRSLPRCNGMPGWRRVSWARPPPPSTCCAGPAPWIRRWTKRRSIWRGCCTTMASWKKRCTWAHHALAAGRSAPRLLQAGWLLQQTGQFADAAEHYQTPSPPTRPTPPSSANCTCNWPNASCCWRRWPPRATPWTPGCSAFRTTLGLLTTLAHWQWRRGDRLAAIGIARRLTELDPERVASWHLLGVFLQDSGDWLAADRCFDQVQQRDLSQSESLFRRAQSQARRRPPDLQRNGCCSMCCIANLTPTRRNADGAGAAGHAPGR